MTARTRLERIERRLAPFDGPETSAQRTIAEAVARAFPGMDAQYRASIARLSVREAALRLCRYPGSAYVLESLIRAGEVEAVRVFHGCWTRESDHGAGPVRQAWWYYGPGADAVAAALAEHAGRWPRRLVSDWTETPPVPVRLNLEGGQPGTEAAAIGPNQSVAARQPALYAPAW